MRLVILSFVLAIYFNFHAAECNIQFSVLDATNITYKQFIEELRQELTIGTTKVYNIPVLKHEAALSQRFILIDLTDYNNDAITLAIDTFNVYIVGYLAGTNSYFLKDAPSVAFSYLFSGSKCTNLTYNGNYADLERGAGALREEIYLGLSPLNYAITSLFHYDATSAPKSFLVIIQMISEAARFKYIEQRVSKSIASATEFLPDPAFRSLENNWGALSTQIQEAEDGQFLHPVELRSVSGNTIQVTNVTSKVVEGIALLLYHEVGSTTIGEYYYNSEISYLSKVLEDDIM